MVCASIAGVAMPPQGGVRTEGKRQTCRPRLARSALLNRATARISGEEKAGEQDQLKPASSWTSRTTRCCHPGRGLG
jgi:hypothetical protein